MAKIGVMMSADRADEEMSSHFGKAEWIMVADTESGTCEFVKNEALNGKGAVEISDPHRLHRRDSLGHRRRRLGAFAGGAHPRLGCASSIAGNEALRMLKEGQLFSVPPARAAARQGMHTGCCCSSTDGSEPAACCKS